MEWQVHSSTPATVVRFVVGHLRVRCIQSYLPVVPGKMAPVVAAVPHCSQRNGPSCCGSGNMGTRLAHIYRSSCFGQYGCSLCPGSERPTADAPAPVLELFLCSILPSDPSRPHRLVHLIQQETAGVSVLYSTGSSDSQQPPASTTGHVVTEQVRLDFFHLEEAVSHYLSRALAPCSGQWRYLAFCWGAGHYLCNL